MENSKITNNQLFSLMAMSNIGGAILFVPALLAAAVKQDAWISALLAVALGTIVMWIYWYLGSLCPSATLLDMIIDILGKWIGIPVAISFIFACFTFCSSIPWYINNFVGSYSLLGTPPLTVMVLFVAAVAISAIYGVETIGRASEVLLFIAVSIFVLSIVLVSPNSKIENLQPILEKGFLPVLGASLHLITYNTMPGVFVMMIYPANCKNPAKSKLPIIIGTMLSCVLMFFATIMCILVLGGPLTAASHSPTYVLAKEISIASIFTRLEFLIALVWVITEFYLGVLTFYSTVTSLSRLLGLKEYKWTVLPMALIILLMATDIFPDEVYQTRWVTFYWPPLGITYGLVLPVILIAVQLIRRFFRKKHG